MTDEQRNEQVEDLDVTPEHSESVKGGAFDAFQKVVPTDQISQKVNIGGLKLAGGDLQKKI